MDYLRIGKLLESDFDLIVESAGGRRFSEHDTQENEENCDYVLGNAVIELKIIEEEGLEKTERREKLAELFKTGQAGRPTVIIDPGLLDEEGQRKFRNIMTTPIKTAVTKAKKQLARSVQEVGGDASRVLMLINEGYGALSHEEFKDFALRRATQDTRKIDALITGGVYYYSDKIDNYTLCPLEMTLLNVERPFGAFTALRAGWHEFVNDFMTGCVRGYNDRAVERLPVVDLEYESDGLRYVKPAPPIGKGSGFYPNGRPRENSTGLEKCPPVAHTFPKLSPTAWNRLKIMVSDTDCFQDSYKEWIEFMSEEDASRQYPIRPFVPVRVTPEGFSRWANDLGVSLSTEALCKCANEIFETKLRKLMDQAVDINDSKLFLHQYVLLVIEEIGQDKANDYGSIVIVRDDGEGPEEERLVEHHPFFFEHGLAIAGAYAIKHDIPAVMYHRSRKYVWE